LCKNTFGLNLLYAIKYIIGPVLFCNNGIISMAHGSHFEYDQLTYTPDKPPYHALVRYRRSNDAKGLAFAQIDSIFDLFVQSLVYCLLVHVLGVQLPPCDGVAVI
jgi:hypothetical protein